MDLDLCSVGTALLSFIAGFAVVVLPRSHACAEGERKRDTEAFAREVEARVAERTEEIRTMYEAQSKFLADISHALQTPMAILRGNVEILEQCAPARVRGVTRIIAATLNSMARLVASILESARWQFAQDKLCMADIAVEALLREVYEDCSVLAEDKGIRLISSCGAGMTIVGDKDKLKEVLFNLISNALKHTDPGGMVSLAGREDGAAAEIAVTDTGCGIPEDRLQDIFERFYRIDGAGVAGTGIGLHICRQIVEAHGGAITAESEVGKGSCFAVRIPRKSLV